MQSKSMNSCDFIKLQITFTVTGQITEVCFMTTLLRAIKLERTYLYMTIKCVFETMSVRRNPVMTQ